MKNLSQPENKIKYIFAFIACFFLAGFTLLGQQVPAEQNHQTKDFKEEDLQKFANAAGKVVVIQQEIEQKMVEAIEEEDLELNKFNEIMMAHQNQQTEEIDASEEELQKFGNAAAKIMELQEGVQEQMVEAIKEEGLEPNVYEEILIAYQSDPKVKEKVDALIQQ